MSKEKVITIRVTSKDKGILKRAAKMRYKSLSRFLIESGKREARRVC